MKIRKINSSDFNNIVKNNNINNEQTKELLRKLREKECFSYINRGSFWYETLTDEQKKELKIWYQGWLDITETQVEPVKPTWLK